MKKVKNDLFHLYDTPDSKIQKLNILESVKAIESAS